MKTKNLFLLPALIAGVGLILAGRVTAQTFTTLYTFTALSGPIAGPFTNSDGAGPRGLFLSGNTLYGTAYQGGPGANGAVFKINTDGTGFTILHSFTAHSSFYPFTNSDGSYPTDLVLSGNTLYGTASYGGSSGWGTVFALNTYSTGFTILHSFTGGSDGVVPQQLILSGDTLYGAASPVFAVNTDGTRFTVVYSGIGSGGVILSGNTLYGTSAHGGSSRNGAVFAVNTDGTGFTTLHSFTELFGPLVSPAVWTAVSPGPVVIDGQNAVTNLISGTQQFYRLSQ